jgi:acyl phosphate:glycerol-3-phosphate acyltransferase
MIALLILAYLLGSVNSALIVCKLMRLPSPREAGSKNPGATNVLRIGGKKAAALTFTGDVLKGIIPVLLGHFYGLSDLSLCWIGFFAVLGHIYPVFFNFQGGKGVATAIGASIAIEPLLGIGIAFSWFVVAFFTRYSSLAAIIAFLLSPLYAVLLLNKLTVVPFGFLAALIIFKHKENIQRLLKGSESKLGNKS